MLYDCRCGIIILRKTQDQKLKEVIEQNKKKNVTRAVNETFFYSNLKFS